MDERQTGKGRLSRLGDVSRNALSLSGASESERCAPEPAAMLATRLFGCYRASDANDPEVYVTAAAAMLAQYPEPIARKVCDPIRGLPASSKFLPAIAEIREACEREMIWDDAVEKRERERRRTAEVLARAPEPTADEKRRVRALADDLLAGLAGDAPPGASVKAPRSPAEAELSRRHHEARLEELAKAPPATVSTPELSGYLARMREEQDLNRFGEAIAS